MPLEKWPYLAIGHRHSYQKWLAPFCSLLDSASDDILVITSKMVTRTEKGEVLF